MRAKDLSGEDKTKGKIDTGLDWFGGLRHLVFPKVLHRACHQKKGTMGQGYFHFFKLFSEFMPDMERPGLSKTDRSDGWIGAELFFVVAMPADTIIAVAIKI